MIIRGLLCSFSVLVLSLSSLFGAGTVTTCDDASLRAALQGGGLVSFAVDGTISITNTLLISDDTVLSADGHAVTLDGSGFTRVFYVATNVQCTLNGLTISNAYSTGGSGLLNDGNTTLTNCVFTANRAVGDNGVAGTWDGTNYTAATAGGSAGGAAVQNYGTINIAGCTFNLNIARGGNGGAAPAGNSFFPPVFPPGAGGNALGSALMNFGVCSVMYSVFATNSVEGGGSPGGTGGNGIGGAIYNSGYLTMGSCNLSDDTADGGSEGGLIYGTGGTAYGGAACNAGGTFYLIGCSLASNQARAGAGAVKGVVGTACGGAYYNANAGNTVFTNGELIGNTALGGFAFGGACFNGSGTLTIAGLTVTNNSSRSSGSLETKGGAIYNDDRLVLTNSAFAYNNAIGGNGVTRFPSGTICCWQVNKGGNAAGGAVYNTSQSGVTNCVFRYNEALGGTGSSYASDRANDGNARGGGIANYGTLTLADSAVEYNEAAGFDIVGGAGIFTTNSPALFNSVVASNTANLSVWLAPSAFSVGANALFEITGNGIADVGYAWRFDITNGIASASNSSYLQSNLQSSDSGQYGALFWNNVSEDIALTFEISPVLTSLPLSRSALPGDLVTFSVGATGSPLHYQWSFNSTNIAGATNASYSFVFSNACAGTYSVAVWNGAGATNASATVTRSDAPYITSQPQSESVNEGGQATFTVSVEGAEPLSYQWRKGGVDLVDGGNVSGATTSNLTISNVLASDAGLYAVVVTNQTGTAASATAALTVNVAPQIVTQPTDRTNILNGIVTMNVTATGTGPLHYQWKKDGVDVVDDGYRFFGANSNQFTIRYLRTVDAGSYYVVVTNGVGSAVSSNAMVVVYLPPAIISQPQSSIIVLGGNSDLAVSATGTDLHYQWRFQGSPIAGATESVLSISNAQFSDAGTYSVVITNLAGSVISSNAQLSVGGLNTLYWQNTNGNVEQWVFIGTNFLSSTPLPQINRSWRLAGAADLNGDGQTDLVFQNSYGRMLARTMDGTNLLSENLVRGGRAAAPLRAISNLDTNSEPDFIFETSLGQLAAWYMADGTNFVSSATMGYGPTGWRLAAMADLNGDGKDDIVWQNSYGYVYVWFMNGKTKTGGTYLRNKRPAAAGWTICGAADLDGNGQKDLLLQNKQGQVQVWLMNQTNYLSSALLRAGQTNAPGWQLRAVAP